MAVMTPISQIQLSAGSTVIIPSVSWQEFETILEELGEKRKTRLAYSKGTLEIMAPLPEHERSKILIADLIKILLKAQRRPWEPLGSTTFKREGMAAGIEPDECFYIQNYRAVIGRERLDLNVDPPPDLAIETDVTSKTESEAYEALKVPELWVYGAGKLTINVLQNDKYVESQLSPTFPDLPSAKIVPRAIERAKQIGSSQALLEFEDWLARRVAED